MKLSRVFTPVLLLVIFLSVLMNSEAQGALLCQKLFTDSKELSQERIWELQQNQRFEEASKLEQKLIDELQNQKVISNEPIGVGLSSARWVKLEGGLEGIWKPDIAVSRIETLDFSGKVISTQDIKIPGSVNKEIASYVINRILGARIVPVTVERYLNGVRGSLQVKVEALENEKHKNYPSVFALFDGLVANSDRHGGNVLTRNGKPIAIDHGLAFTDAAEVFQFLKQWQNSDSMLNSSSSNTEKTKALLLLKELAGPRPIYERLVSTTYEEWNTALKDLLSRNEYIIFITRKNAIVEVIQSTNERLGDEIFADAEFSPLIREGKD